MKLCIMLKCLIGHMVTSKAESFETQCKVLQYTQIVGTLTSTQRLNPKMQTCEMKVESLKSLLKKGGCTK